MAISFGFFLDPALTTHVASRPQFLQAQSAPSPAIKVLYFGSPIAGRTCKASVNPGVDPVLVSVIDAGTSTGIPVSALKLALSEAGLASAVAGAPLSLPAEIASGPAGAVPIYLQVLTTSPPSGVHNDLSITTNSLGEWG